MPSTKSIISVASPTAEIGVVTAIKTGFNGLGFTLLNETSDATYYYLIYSKSFYSTVYGTCFVKIRITRASLLVQQSLGTGYTAPTTLLNEGGFSSGVTLSASLNTFAKTWLNGTFNLFQLFQSGTSWLFGVFAPILNGWDSNIYFPFLQMQTNGGLTPLMGGCATAKMLYTTAATILMASFKNANYANKFEYFDRLIFFVNNYGVWGETNTDVICGASTIGTYGQKLDDYELAHILDTSNLMGLYLR